MIAGPEDSEVFSRKTAVGLDWLNSLQLTSIKFIEFAFPAMTLALDEGRINAGAIAQPLPLEVKRTERVLASPDAPPPRRRAAFSIDLRPIAILIRRIRPDE